MAGDDKPPPNTKRHGWADADVGEQVLQTNLGHSACNRATEAINSTVAR
ncbi:hypothetical protein [Haloplanus vescus]|nr:hypothetical protein [Haloplanus vescus]